MSEDYPYQPISEAEWDLLPDEQRELLREVRPWDFVLPGTPRAVKACAEARYAVCKGCEHFRPYTRTCGECGCLMKLKVHLADAFCPVGHWGPASNEERKV